MRRNEEIREDQPNLFPFRHEICRVTERETRELYERENNISRVCPAKSWTTHVKFGRCLCPCPLVTDRRREAPDVCALPTRSPDQCTTSSLWIHIQNHLSLYNKTNSNYILHSNKTDTRQCTRAIHSTHQGAPMHYLGLWEFPVKICDASHITTYTIPT